MHQVLTRELGEDWRDFFAEFSDTPAAAASIGQVHEAVWHDGRRVAVKIQYPGAGRALIGDFNQLSRAGRLFGMLMPGLDVKPLLDELKDRISEELDYELEAMSQQMFADAYAGDPDIYVPNVVMATGQVLVSDWMDGTPLSRIISRGQQGTARQGGNPARSVPILGTVAGRAAARGPAPGQLPPARRRAPGRARLRRGGPAAGRAAAVLRPAAADHARRRRGHRGSRARTARATGSCGTGIHVDLDALHAFLAPLAEPSKVDSFKFTREWMREEASRVTDMRASNISRQFNVPPSYVLIHRVSTAGIGVLCQLECEGEFRAEVLRWVPGYFDPPRSPWRPGGQPVIPFGTAIMARDMTAMAGLLHPDATFTSPAVFRPYQGRAAVLRVLTAATQTIEDFAYTGEAHGPGMDVLRFRGRVGQYQLEGVDIVTTGEDGLITDVTVMVRPLRGLEALVGGMQQALARLAEG